MLFREFRTPLAFTLALLYTLAVMKPLVPVLDYTVHYGTYSNVLCENKDKPELSCKGTCQLAEKLNLMESSDTKPVLPEFESLYWYIAVEIKDDATLAGFWALQKDFNFFSKEALQSIYLDLPTPPPIV